MQPVELYPGVLSDPANLGGKPVIKGTRVPVALTLGKLAGGMSIEEVTYEYYINLADVRAALVTQQSRAWTSPIAKVNQVRF